MNSWTNIQTTGQTLTTTSAHTSHTSEQREEKEGGQTKADTPAAASNGLLDSSSSQLHQQVLTGDQFHGRCICGSGLLHPISSLLAQLHCGPETMLHRLLSEVTLEDQTFSCHAEPTQLMSSCPSLSSMLLDIHVRDWSSPPGRPPPLSCSF